MGKGQWCPGSSARGGMDVCWVLLHSRGKSSGSPGGRRRGGAAREAVHRADCWCVPAGLTNHAEARPAPTPGGVSEGPGT